ncbi:MAG TPA: GGDEF domain-containing protein [Blastocatellia bacterium]|nr:GGDEF domain-containing protein [Blastocatellia bacterium]
MSGSVAQALARERERLLLRLSAQLKSEQEKNQRRRIAVSDLLGELPRLFDLVWQELEAETPEKGRLKSSTVAQQHGARRVEQGVEVGLLFREFSLIRSLVEEVIRQHAPALSKEELLETQSRVGSIIERLLYLSVSTYTHKQTQELSDQARRDPLTRLLNRATFDVALSDEVDRAQRYNRDLSVVLLDVDRFKQVNDRFGHQAGDEVLLSVARMVQSSLRHSDTAFRYGGDEFAAICPETPGEVMQGVMHRVEVSVISYLADSPVSEECGISWGVASYPADATKVAELMRIADERLYECKKQHHQRLDEQKTLAGENAG